MSPTQALKHSCGNELYEKWIKQVSKVWLISRYSCFHELYTHSMAIKTNAIRNPVTRSGFQTTLHTLVFCQKGSGGEFDMFSISPRQCFLDVLRQRQFETKNSELLTDPEDFLLRVCGV